MVSSRGGRFGFVYKNRQKAYLSILARVGGNKSKAAAIANAGHTASGRRSMAKKAARTRKMKRGRIK
jgi:hypothetical protein